LGFSSIKSLWFPEAISVTKLLISCLWPFLKVTGEFPLKEKNRPFGPLRAESNAKK
jgi:hypothetical protein